MLKDYFQHAPGIDEVSYLDRLEPETEFDLFLWLRRTVTRCTITAIYGSGNSLTRDAEKLDDAFWFVPHQNYLSTLRTANRGNNELFRDSDKDLNLLILDIFPSIIASRAHRARLALVKGFESYFQNYVPGQTECFSMTHSRRTINTKYSLTPSNAAHLKVGALLGVLVNIVLTIFHTVMHIFCSPELLRSIRDELEATSIHHSPDGKIRTLKVLIMREKCIILHATFKEVLRHHVLSTSVRCVRDDKLLDDKYLLKKGRVVQTPMAVLHKWTQPLSDPAHRFLNTSDGAKSELKQTPAAAFRPLWGRSFPILPVDM